MYCQLWIIDVLILFKKLFGRNMEENDKADYTRKINHEVK